MHDILLRNFELLDPREGKLESGHQVLVRDGVIVDVTPGVTPAGKAQVLDLGGRTLMPGLIDCHVHVALAMPMAGMTPMLPSLTTAAAGDSLRKMLMRGFTTVRDAGGADLGLKQAVERGYFLGPRLFVSGRAISQTGGHGDDRLPTDEGEPCSCAHMSGGIARIADGVGEVRRAVRDELRRGADQIKVMVSGGVGSPSDPLEYLQYSGEELEAIVDEAHRRRTYVLAHAYTAAAITRAVEAGVRTIEHGNFLDERTAALMGQRGAYLVPTLVVYRAISTHGRHLKVLQASLAKNDEVLMAGARSLEIARAAGVKLAYGTDLFLSPPPQDVHDYQSDELLIRAEVLTPAEIIRSATTIGAEVLAMEGRLGRIQPGAWADLLVVDGNPLEDLNVLTQQGKCLAAIIKGGRFVKNTL